MESQTLSSLFAALRDENPKVRVGAMVVLAKHGTVEALPKILEAVNVRPANIFGLENSGWKMQLAITRIAQQDPEAALRHLIAALGSPEVAVKEVAAGVIEALYAEDMSLAEELFKKAGKK